MPRWAFLIGGVVLVLIFLAIPAVPRVMALLDQGPEQPIAFDHSWHVKGVGLDCRFCHRTTDKEAAAGIPALEQCMFCHRVVGTGKAEVEKLRATFNNNEPINWRRVYRVPDHVRFVHEPHLRAGLQCSNCHGAVEEMRRVRQVRPMKMGDCLECHRSKDAPTDCYTCHY